MRPLSGVSHPQEALYHSGMGGPDGGLRMSEEKPPTGKQKQIAISEFFEKNKHFLGFDSLQRSIITAVKESVSYTHLTLPTIYSV